MPNLVLKGEFARLVNRTPAAVSQWLAAGKLRAPAIVGEGRRARIDVDLALQQLGIALDLGQQLAQPAPILATPAGRPAPAGDLFAAPRPAVDEGGDQARLLRARADREELARQREQAEAEEQAGRWLVAAAAAEAWSGELARLMAAVDSWLVTGAATAAVAAAPGGPRAVGAALRAGFHDLRGRLAEEAARPVPEADLADDSGDGGDDGEEP